MNFFESNDLEYFSSVIGKKFEQNELANKEFKETGEILSNQGVYAKTDYWARLIKEEGYLISFKYHWQNARRIRKYTWAKIYMNGFEQTQIYFTVGVGSRRTVKDQYVSTLEYKLDCQRKKGLSPYQIHLFDEYLKKYDRNTSWKTIDISELDQLNWKKLKEITLNFIEQHEDHYRALVNIVWPNGVGVLPKIARVCWNKNQWKSPSGPEGKSKSPDAFEKEKGYGYEEWLFDMDKKTDGYHYAFLQAFNKGQHEGKIYDVKLYTIEYDEIAKSHKYYWTGHLPYVEVLTKVQKDTIIDIYKANGWYNEMLNQLNSFGIPNFNFDPIPEEHIFNIRFRIRPGFYKQYDPLVEISYPQTEIGKNRHYVLLDKPVKTGIYPEFGKYVFKEGHNPAKTGLITTKPTKQSYKKTLLHQQIQTNIYEQFQTLYDRTNIKVGTEIDTGYGTCIDLVVNNLEEGDVFYEIKTGATALGCIREALGQIIEYCYYAQAFNASKLIIVSPHELKPQDILYIQHLRDSLELEIYYQWYSKQTKKLESQIY